MNAHEKAIKRFDEVIRQSPNDVKVYYKRGLEKYKLGESILEEYNQGKALMMFGEAHMTAAKVFSEAQDDLKECLELNKKSAVLASGEVSIVKKEIKEMERVKRRTEMRIVNRAMGGNLEAIERNPDDPLAYYNLGVAKNVLGDHEEAIRNFDQVIRLTPKDAEAHYHRGTSKGALEKYEEAIKDFDQAIQLDPEYAKAYNKRGFQKLRLGEWVDAYKDFSEAIRLNPEDADSFCNRGFVGVTLGMMSLATESAEKALQCFSVARNNLKEGLRLHNENDAFNSGQVSTIKNAIRAVEEQIMKIETASDENSD